MLVDQVRVREPDGFVVGLAVLQKAVVGSFALHIQNPPSLKLVLSIAFFVEYYQLFPTSFGSL